MVAGLGPFALVRTLAGLGRGQTPLVTLPRYATLESARSIHRPSMGLFRRPTPGKKRRTDNWVGPAGRARIRAHSQKTNLRLRRPKGAA